jgi:DNA-binding CsgD family transcriptional regulator
MRMQTEATVESCLGAVILSLRQDGFAQCLWDLFQALAAPDNLVILAYRDAAPPLMLFNRAENRRVFQRLQTTYLSGAYRLDPYFELHLARVSDGAYRIRDIAPDAFQRSRYFTEYFGATTLIDEIAFVVPLADGLSLNLCLGRDARSGRAFSAEDVAVCRRFSPAIAALARVEWRGLERGSAAPEDTPGLLIEAAGRQGIALSPRQAMVALLILRGHSTPSIALRLGISPQTVKVFRKQLYQRCKISSQAELFTLMLPLLQG